MDNKEISKELTKIAHLLEAAVPGQPIFDYDGALDAAKLLKAKIKAPYVGAKLSTLGGKDRVAIMIVFSLDEKSDWPNNILENSNYARLDLSNNGTLEMFSGYMPKNMRKTKAKSVEDAVAKINKYISAVGNTRREG